MEQGRVEEMTGSSAVVPGNLPMSVGLSHAGLERGIDWLHIGDMYFGFEVPVENCISLLCCM